MSFNKKNFRLPYSEKKKLKLIFLMEILNPPYSEKKIVQTYFPDRNFHSTLILKLHQNFESTLIKRINEAFNGNVQPNKFFKKMYLIF